MATGSDAYSWITAQTDGTEHAVSHTAQAASAAEGHGVYEALCGVELLAASMDAGPARRCAHCVAFLRARVTMCDVDRRMAAPGPGWLSRLCPRRQPTKPVGRHRADQAQGERHASG